LRRILDIEARFGWLEGVTVIIMQQKQNTKPGIFLQAD
tara:strand:- start:144 stop:257 length:114 start_codon:yes stop_codon:yes gene_type:complete